MRRGSGQARRGWLPVIVALAACNRAPVEPLPTPAETRALADAACPAVTRPLFFKIEKAGRISHLLGTRHVGVPLAKFPEPVVTAFRAAKTAVFESIAHVPDPVLPLPQELGAARWEKLRRLLGPAEAERVKGSAGLAIAALLTLYEDKSAYLDVELQELARKLHLELVALEDAATSAEIGRQLASPGKLAELLDALGSRATLRAATETGLRGFCSTGSGSDAEPTPALDRLGEQRNRAWLVKLVPLLERGEVFVAVGSTHLTGETGLAALLRRDGFAVTDLGATE